MATKASASSSYRWALVDRLIIVSYVMFIFIALTVDCINAFGQRNVRTERYLRSLSTAFFFR